MTGKTSRKGTGGIGRRRWHLYLLALLGISIVCGAAEQPRTRRRTPRASQQQAIQFPTAHTSSAVSFETTLTRQQEQRELPSNRPLQPSEIGQLAWAAHGVTVVEAAVGAVAAQPRTVASLSASAPIKASTACGLPIRPSASAAQARTAVCWSSSAEVSGRTARGSLSSPAARAAAAR